MSLAPLPEGCRRRSNTLILLRCGVLAAVAALGYMQLWLGALLLLSLVGALLSWLLLCPTTRLLGPVTTALPATEQGILITLDDGPDPDTTSEVLDLLDEYHTKALFFVIGQRVQQWPELAQEILRRGHELGNHTQHHPSASFWALSAQRTYEEVAQCQASIHAVCNILPRWFRAPVGHYQLHTHPALDALHLRLMAWSARGYDAVQPHPERVLIQLSPHLIPGAIVLLHEGRSWSVPTLRAVLQEVQQRGLIFAKPADAWLG